MGDTEDTLTLVLKARDLASREVGAFGSKIDGIRSKFDGLLPSGLALATGVGAVVGGLALAVRSAAEEQKGIARLDEALKANVKGWDGNRDAIEKVISKREDLSFSDGELRDSLSVLVTSTGDVTKALDLQQLAMDLARARGVSLEAASQAVAKATQGSTKELKAMGLAIDDGATATENLLTIQKATAGQAETYAKTMNGKWDTFQNKIGDVVEDIGSALLPVLEGLVDFATTDLIPIIQGVVGVIGQIAAIVDEVRVALDKLFAVGEYGKTHFDFGKASSGPLAHHAAGGRVAPGWSMFGETGPELVHMDAPGDAFSAAETSRMVAGGDGQPAVIQVQLDGKTIAEVVDAHLYYLARRAAPIGY